MDFSEKMLEEAQRKMPKARFHQQDLNQGIPKDFENEEFDYIISSYALHHLSNPAKVRLIEELLKLLKKEG